MFIELTSDWVNEWNNEHGSPPNDLLGLLSFLQDHSYSMVLPLMIF